MLLPRHTRSAYGEPSRPSSEDSAWLEAFHRGDRTTMERCYRDHFETLEAAIGGILGSADRETVIHEVFSRLVGGAELRRSFQGGSLGAWLATVGRNQAIDYRRRHGRETELDAERPAEPATVSWQEAADARLLIERFRREQLPAEWVGVFEACFIQQLSQREAARALGIRRTTLAYREMRIRRQLRKFLLEDEDEGDSP
jgi:RNA polymerase sigma-70 factor (ECF subfamily)